LSGSVALALARRNRDMNRTLQIAWVFVFALGLATGCRKCRTREFVAAEQPVKFENWRLYVNAFVDAANPSPTNHLYVINAMAETLPVCVYRGDTNEFLPSPYDASMNLLRLFRIEDTNVVELPLPPLRQGFSDQPNRLVQLFHGSGTAENHKAGRVADESHDRVSTRLACQRSQLSTEWMKNNL
jgi:hypothetical protein